MYQKHACAFMRTLAKPGELWQTLANPQRHIHGDLPTFTRVPAKVPSVRGWPSECAQKTCAMLSVLALVVGGLWQQIQANAQGGKAGGTI